MLFRYGGLPDGEDVRRTTTYEYDDLYRLTHVSYPFTILIFHSETSVATGTIFLAHIL